MIGSDATPIDESQRTWTGRKERLHDYAPSCLDDVIEVLLVPVPELAFFPSQGLMSPAPYALPSISAPRPNVEAPPTSTAGASHAPPWNANDAPSALVDNMPTHSVRVDAPAHVVPSTAFMIAVDILLGTASGANTAPIKPLDLPPEGLPVHIAVNATGEVRCTGPATVERLIFPSRDSDPAGFAMQALSAGTAEVDVRVWTTGRSPEFLGQVRLAIDVSDPGNGQPPVPDPRPSPQSSFNLNASAPRDGHWNEAIIEVDGDDRALSFTFRGIEAAGFPERKEARFSMPVSQWMQDLRERLDRIAMQGLVPAAVESALKSQGAEIWKVIPRDIQDRLLDHLDTLHSVAFIGNSDPVPWELAFVPRHHGRDGFFLADRALVRRWAFNAGRAPQSVGMGNVRFVVPDSAPAAALTELAALQQLLGIGGRIKTLEQLMHTLDAPTFGVLHFAAHNTVSGSAASGSQVTLDVAFHQDMVGAARTNAFGDNAPLVFMNACSSAAATPTWNGSTGWAARFIEAGAAVFVGSLWSVRDEPAKTFAERFYQCLTKGEPFGRAFTNARRAVHAAGDPTRLGYTFFGNASAILSTPTS